MTPWETEIKLRVHLRTLFWGRSSSQCFTGGEQGFPFENKRRLLLLLAEVAVGDKKGTVCGSTTTITPRSLSKQQKGNAMDSSYQTGSGL